MNADVRQLTQSNRVCQFVEHVIIKLLLWYMHCYCKTKERHYHPSRSASLSHAAATKLL